MFRESGLPARDFAQTNPADRSVVTEGEFATAVAGGKLTDVAEKSVVDGGIQTKLDQIAELTEAAKAFSLENEEQRAQYVADREAARTVVETLEPVSERRVEQKRAIFRELDMMDEFLVREKRGEYLATRHSDDPRLAQRLRQNARLEAVLAKRRAALETDPDTRTIVREHVLDRYKRELDTQHFVLTPSRREYVDRIEILFNAGKPVFLEGHTGAGKTELARIAVVELTGKEPEVIRCNPQTRPSELWGKVKLTAPDH
ncbi:MAG: hypothetical protein WBO92_04280, partial [Candidatus Moraniibacteriota bacterium]